MVYAHHFSDADSFLEHVDELLTSISNPLIEQRYLGFVTVSAVTVYELALKEIFIEFCSRKHPVFGHFSQSNFERINGRISLDDLRNSYIKRYGKKYLERFNKKIDDLERRSLHAGNGSIKTSYGNVLSWRNRFVHNGMAPTTTTFAEIRASYERGKGVIHCVAESMVR